MRLVISTNSAFHRHYVRVRRWYGVDSEPAKCGGLCKPCQTMFWGTLLAALVSPFVLVGWALDRLQDWLNLEVVNMDAMPAAPVARTALSGAVALMLGSVAALVCGIVLLGAWNIADVAAAIRGAALCGGWYLFAGLAGVGGALLLAAGWAAQHCVALLAVVAAWFAGRALYAAACFLTRPLARRRAARREARIERREARLAARRDAWEPKTWTCRSCGNRNQWDWCDCGAAKPVGAARRLWRWAAGRTVGGKAHVASGIGIVWIWLKAIAKGTCPLVEFLSPDELRALSKGPARPKTRSV
jgi:hypothetical protein